MTGIDDVGDEVVRSLPDAAQRTVAAVLGSLRSEPDLCWIHGQGSVFSRFTDDSDLDFIVVWDAGVPSHPTLTDLGDSRLAAYESVVDWPLPIYAASGLAHGVILHDPAGVGARLQSGLAVPPTILTESVHTHLVEVFPGLVSELERCAERGDQWLRQNLSVQLMKVIYTAWFLTEGWLPPFPNGCPPGSSCWSWIRLWCSFERDCRQASSIQAATTALKALGNRVLAP